MAPPSPAGIAVGIAMPAEEELAPPVGAVPPPVNVWPFTTVTPFDTTILDPDSVVPEAETDESVNNALLEAEADGMALEEAPILIVAPLEKVLPEIVTPPLEELCATACVAIAATMRARLENCIVTVSQATNGCEAEKKCGVVERKA